MELLLELILLSKVTVYEVDTCWYWNQTPLSADGFDVTRTAGVTSSMQKKTWSFPVKTLLTKSKIGPAMIENQHEKVRGHDAKIKVQNEIEN